MRVRSSFIRFAVATTLLSWNAQEAAAQSPYPTTMQPSYGGYSVAQSVPYQPTFPQSAQGEAQSPGAYSHLDPSPSRAAPIVTYDSPPPGYLYTDAAPAATPGPPAMLGPPATIDPNTGQMWQPYPPPGTTGPAGSPLMAPQEPIYPSTPEPNLRASLTPPDARDGVFQKAKFTGTWLPKLDDGGLGWTDLHSELVLALPFFTRENPIIITPSYEAHFLDRPEGFDLPPRLHDLEIDFHIFRVYDNQWIFDLAVAPGLFADDHSFDSDDALRVNGRALAIYAPTLEWKWVLGVTYVDGGWSKVVPVAGVVYEPNDDVKYELVFPRPRVAWRLPQSPVPGRDEYWFYVMGEFANSAWAFQRSDGIPDVLAYRDFRAIVGLERKILGGLSHRVEVGYVFNRDMKIASQGGEDIGLDSTILLRAGIVY